MLEPSRRFFFTNRPLCEEKSHGVGPCPSPIAGAWRWRCVPPQRAAGSRSSSSIAAGPHMTFRRRRWAGQSGCRRRAALEERSGLGVDGGAAVVVAGRQQALAALCLHQVARLDVCNRAPSSCLCHVTVRDRFAGFSSSVLCWSGFERSNTMRKLLRMILCVPVTPSNTSSVPPAITGPRAPIQGARSIFWPK